MNSDTCTYLRLCGGLYLLIIIIIIIMYFDQPP